MGTMTYNIFVRKPFQNDSDMLILDGGIIDYDEAARSAWELWEALGAANVNLGYIAVGVIADDGWVMTQHIIRNSDF